MEPIEASTLLNACVNWMKREKNGWGQSKETMDKMVGIITAILIQFQFHYFWSYFMPQYIAFKLL